jgi:hypothetical protein
MSTAESARTANVTSAAGYLKPQVQDVANERGIL